MLDPFKFPLRIKTKITSIANDFYVKDAYNQNLFFVEQKLLPIKADIHIFTDDSKEKLLYTIKLDGSILSFDVSFTFYNSANEYLGRIRHPNIETNWTSHYEIYDKADQLSHEINVDDRWTKVWNQKLKNVPIVKFFTGYIMNPSYTLIDRDNYELFLLKKDPSFLGNHFSINELSDTSTAERELCLLALFMMLLLERWSG